MNKITNELIGKIYDTSVMKERGPMNRTVSYVCAICEPDCVNEAPVSLCIDHGRIGLVIEKLSESPEVKGRIEKLLNDSMINGCGIMSKDEILPVFQCPKCNSVSHNPNDVQHQYCARCHEYHGQKISNPYGQDIEDTAFWLLVERLLKKYNYSGAELTERPMFERYNLASNLLSIMDVEIDELRKKVKGS